MAPSLGKDKTNSNFGMPPKAKMSSVKLTQKAAGYMLAAANAAAAEAKTKAPKKKVIKISEMKRDLKSLRLI